MQTLRNGYAKTIALLLTGSELREVFDRRSFDRADYQVSQTGANEFTIHAGPKTLERIADYLLIISES
jgi:hypothetical protein